MQENKFTALEKKLNAQNTNIAGIVMQKDGETLFENYAAGYTQKDAFHIYSVTKSIFSALIGIALDRGYIGSIDQKVLAFFPEYQGEIENKTAAEVTIKHLLTMTAPYTFETEPYEAFFSSENWVKTALTLLGGETMGAFRYSPVISTHILSGILVKTTGQSVLDFAGKNLFSPLGIALPQSIELRDEKEHMAFAMQKGHAQASWATDPQGIHTASWGLCLSPSDMAKIGQLYLSNGLWNGKRILSAQWIKESTKEHVALGELSYGYLWWIINDENHIYAALGDGGNAIYVNASKKLVVAIASIFTENAPDILAFISEYIEPLF